ncbi:MAG: PEP-CTERM sorting domain-containing protein [Pirellulales bacterium]|nr:PEP-CTERM sorting domain-containing protein [Pirellulales bacterium]
MRFARLLFFIGAAVLAVSFGLSAQAGGVSVGSSSLIGALDYSDTFTGTDFGGLPDRDAAGGWPLSAVDYPSPGNGVFGEGLAVESTYGNPARSWVDGAWSIARDGTALNGESIYPGDSGAGSATGMTQTGPWGSDWGIGYGLRDRFVLQFDAVQVRDRVDLTFGSAVDSIWGADNVTVFVRSTDNPLGYAQITLFNPTIGEVNTGLTSGTLAGQWYNYAVLVDIPERTVEVFVDEVSRGVIDIDAMGDAFAALTLSNAAVNVGFYGYTGENTPRSDRFWTDNFQVGSAIPEPGTAAMLLGGLVGLMGILRKRRA